MEIRARVYGPKNFRGSGLRAQGLELRSQAEQMISGSCIVKISSAVLELRDEDSEGLLISDWGLEFRA